MLKVEKSDPHAQFQPGQWVDFFPPQFENPGGFSISSAPNQLPEIELAIRQSEHPVVKWVFDSCQAGQDIQESFSKIENFKKFGKISLMSFN